MSESNFSKRWSLWLQWACLLGMVAVGFNFVFDPATPKLYKLLIAVGALGFILFFFLRGGVAKANHWEEKLLRKDGCPKSSCQNKKPHARRHGAFVLLMRGRD